MAKYVTLKRIYQRVWLLLSNLPMSGHGVRPLFVKMGGVKILDPKKQRLLVLILIGIQFILKKL